MNRNVMAGLKPLILLTFLPAAKIYLLSENSIIIFVMTFSFIWSTIPDIIYCGRNIS